MSTNENQPLDSVSSMRLLAEKLGDQETSIPSIEIKLMRDVIDKASDYIKANEWPEFATACGGVEKLKDELISANHAYETWINDGDG